MPDDPRAPVINKLIFDDSWHPLDHRIFDARCRQHPSPVRGARLHWEYWRDFMLPEYLSPLYRRVLCKRGFHKTQVWFRTGEVGATVMCAHCEWAARDELP